jgi:hypothetical protein
MANLNSDIVVSVSSESAPVSATNFGIPLYAADGASLGAGFTERIRFYNTAAESNGDADLSAAAKGAMTAAFSQNPRVTTAAVGRVDTASFVAQLVTWTFSGTPEVGDVMSITVNGIETNYTAAGTVLNTEVSALAALVIAALAGEDVTAADATPAITATADNDGESFTYDSSVTLVGSGDLAVAEVLTTPNVGVSTDLAAILAESSNWYGLAIWSRSKGHIMEAALWTEANYRLFLAQSSDADILTAATGNVLERLGAFSYERTALLYHATDSEYGDMAWLSSKLAVDPDQSTTFWRYQTLSGVAVDDLTSTEIANVRDNDGNVYEEFFGTNVTSKGRTVDGNPIDVLITVDWTRARMEERIAQALIDASNRGSVIPYTNDGITTFTGIVDGVLEDGVGIGHFTRIDDANGRETPWAQSPRVENVPAADKQNRLVRVQFLAQRGDAIEEGSVTGYVLADVTT